MIDKRTKNVSGLGRITKALTGYYPRQLKGLITHYSRINGLLPGHLDYERFIILGQERTGSTFLQSLLNSHSQIVAFGEIYRRFDAVCWDYDFYRREVPSSQLSRFQKDPIGFLETHVFARFPRMISAVGFKLFYTHARHPMQRSLWAYLKDRKAIKIIHIKRKNALRTYLSLEMAKKVSRWKDLSGNCRDEEPTIQLNYDDCLRQFVNTRKQEKQHDLFFENHEKIDLIYEDLSRDYTNEMKRVQQFLGVENRDLVASTYKQAKRPLCKAISNYDELAVGFKGTQWESFFED